MMDDHKATLPLFVERLTGAQSQLYAFIVSLLPGGGEAADVLQETNKALWQKAAEYDPARPFLPWAMQFARWQVMAHRKRVARDRLVFDDELVDQLATAFEHSDPGERQLHALELCLKKLPPAQRALVAAKYEHGEAVNDIATREGKPANAVSALLYRIRAALAECVERTLAAEAP
jgi:RNA polymerase sigma-70 factor (ECF subfamily)